MPVTFKAGLAFVAEHSKLIQSDKKLDADQITELALDKASKAFSDSFSEDTDHSRSLYVQRSFDNFEPLRTGLPEWAKLLYEDLLNAADMEGAAT